MSATLRIKNSEFLKIPVIQNTFWGPLQIFWYWSIFSKTRKEKVEVKEGKIYWFFIHFWPMFPFYTP